MSPSSKLGESIVFSVSLTLINLFLFSAYSFEIKISTGIECQGLHEDNYLNSYEVKYAPNPIDNYLDLYFGGNDNFIEIGIYTVNGQLIDIKNINLPFYSRNYRLETSNYKQGVYIIKISGATIDQSIQVIKK